MSKSHVTADPTLAAAQIPPVSANGRVTTVLIVDDHALVRNGLRMILEAAGVRVIGEADNGLDAVAQAKELGPDIVLLDLEMPRLNGSEAARQIARYRPASKILVLSTHSGSEIVRELIGAGISGYLTKDTAAEQLLAAVRELACGNTYFTPALSRQLLEQSRQAFGKKAPVTPRVELTSRETEVLQLVAEGNANKQIADILAISIKTVEKHRQSLMRKLDIHETATLTRYAVSHSIVACHRRSLVQNGN